MLTKYSITQPLLQVTRDICSLKKIPLHNADTFSFFLPSNACTCQPASTKERSVVHLHKPAFICINQAAALCITLIWNAYCVLWWWQAMRGSNSQLQECLPWAQPCTGVSKDQSLSPPERSQMSITHSRQSVLLLLSSPERERLFSPHFLSVVLS